MDIIASVILVDIGSSTFKVYRFHAAELKLLYTRTLPLKDQFDPDQGLSVLAQQSLFAAVAEIKNQYPQTPVYCYGTALFRKLSPAAQIHFLKEFTSHTGFAINILGQDMENAYLESALLGKFNPPYPVAFINIGGGSTEIAVVQNHIAVKRINIGIGVGTVNSQFPELNHQISGISLPTVTEYIRSQLPDLEDSVAAAFYVGGELTYMRLLKYPLIPNHLFSDPDHPSIISLKDFTGKNAAVFTAITLTDLESFMPDNPLWMHGARGCSAFAQAICEKYDIQTIIPSDSNLINGIVQRDFLS
jgi:hypothetical protein